MTPEQRAKTILSAVFCDGEQEQKRAHQRAVLQALWRNSGGAGEPSHEQLAGRFLEAMRQSLLAEVGNDARRRAAETAAQEAQTQIDAINFSETEEPQS